MQTHIILLCPNTKGREWNKHFHLDTTIAVLFQFEELPAWTSPKGTVRAGLLTVSAGG